MSFNNDTLPWQKFFDGLAPTDPIRVLAESIGPKGLAFEVEFVLCAQLAALRQLREINPKSTGKRSAHSAFAGVGHTNPPLADMTVLELYEQVRHLCRQFDPAENPDKVVLKELCQQMERLSQSLGDISAQLRRYSANGTNGKHAEESTADL